MRTLLVLMRHRSLVAVIMILGVCTVAFVASFFVDGSTFKQPRDAFELHSPAYARVLNRAKNTWTPKTPQAELDVDLSARAEALDAEWHLVATALANPDNWKPNIGGEYGEWEIRDDWLRIQEAAGGLAAVKRCRPILHWQPHYSGLVQHNVRGLECGDHRYWLQYQD